LNKVLRIQGLKFPHLLHSSPEDVCNKTDGGTSFKQNHHKQKVNSKVLGWFLAIETVDGRNPAPPEMYKTL